MVIPRRQVEYDRVDTTLFGVGRFLQVLVHLAIELILGVPSEELTQRVRHVLN